MSMSPRLLPETGPQTFTTRGPWRQPPLRTLAFKSYNSYSQNPRVMSLLLPHTVASTGSLLPPKKVSKLYEASEPFLQDKILLKKKKQNTVLGGTWAWNTD